MVFQRIDFNYLGFSYKEEFNFSPGNEDAPIPMLSGLIHHDFPLFPLKISQESYPNRGVMSEKVGMYKKNLKQEILTMSETESQAEIDTSYPPIYGYDTTNNKILIPLEKVT